MKLLDDEQIARFLYDGFVVLEPDELGADFNALMFDPACEVHDDAGRIGGDSGRLQVIGDNLRARIPELQQLLSTPTVRGALTSVLGEDYLLHPHHFVHEASAHDQSFHQDGNLPWNDRAHYRTHRPNWAMLFYYPQRVTDDNGPTEVLPGTQYWTTNFENPDGTWHGGDALVKHGRQDALRSDDARVRRVAGAAAGEARLSSGAVVDALFRHLEEDPDDLVRSNAAYALGNIARVPGVRISAPRLLACLGPSEEPDNSSNGGMSRSTVRESVMYALGNLELDGRDLATLATSGLADHDRYVHGLTVAVLERHARARAEPWMRTFVADLERARFNHRPPRPAPT